MQTPYVSVIVPVYSGRKYFEQLLDLLLRQTLHNIELIFIDDRGNDDAFALAEEAAKRDNRIVLIKTSENAGPGFCRNRGIEAAKGEYIGFVDCDDIIPLEYFERLYNKAIETNAIVAKCSRATLYEDGKVEYSPLNSRIRKDLNDGVHLLNAFTYEHQTAIYKRAHVLQNHARNSTASQDEDTAFIMKVMHNVPVSAFVLIDDLMYYYRKHAQSITQTKDKRFLDESQSNFEQAHAEFSTEEFWRKYVKLDS